MLCHMARPGGADGTRAGPAAAAAPLLFLLPPPNDPAARRGWATGASRWREGCAGCLGVVVGSPPQLLERKGDHRREDYKSRCALRPGGDAGGGEGRVRLGSDWCGEAQGRRRLEP